MTNEAADLLRKLLAVKKRSWDHSGLLGDDPNEQTVLIHDDCENVATTQGEKSLARAELIVAAVNGAEALLAERDRLVQLLTEEERLRYVEVTARDVVEARLTIAQKALEWIATNAGDSPMSGREEAEKALVEIASVPFR